MTKENRLVAAIEQEIQRQKLLERLRNQLEDKSLRDLQAVEHLLERRKDTKSLGAPRTYSDDEVLTVEAGVREMKARLKAEGKPAGTRSAIRALVEHLFNTVEYLKKYKGNDRKIKEWRGRIHKIYEAGRKRG